MAQNAVGGNSGESMWPRSFVEQMEQQLGGRALYRHMDAVDGACRLYDSAVHDGSHSAGEMAGQCQKLGLDSGAFAINSGCCSGQTMAK